MARRLSKKARALLAAVTGKRARIVVDHILKHGSITTDVLKETYGYDHAPRAIKDVSDQGIPIEMTFVRKPNGKRMAEYRFGDLEQPLQVRGGGRGGFPRAFKDALLAAQGARCAHCDSALEPRYLQIDHRVPFAIAGDRDAKAPCLEHHMLLCGSCNRAKSWSCEHCPNLLSARDQQTCESCYWASPRAYTHVATRSIRRMDLTWVDAEVTDYDAAKRVAGPGDSAMPKFVKNAVKRAISDAILRETGEKKNEP